MIAGIPAVICAAVIVALPVLLFRTLSKQLKQSDQREGKRMVHRTFGETLKAKRIDKKMKQEVVTESPGILRQAVSKWENRTSDPSS